MRMIDFEAHCYIPEFTGKFDKVAIDEANQHLPEGKKITILDDIVDLDETRLERMDKYGITTQILSCSSGMAHLDNVAAIVSMKS